MTKQCKSCKVDLELSNFHKKKCGKYGVSSKCKKCTKEWQEQYYYERNKIERIQRQSQSNYQKYIRKHRLKKNYGMTLEEYDRLLKSQHGKCAICKGDDIRASPSSKYLSVDHCHATGKIRELLCGRCNMTLGGVEEDVHLLRSMINYINKHKD